jgi:hypothetical protein
MSWSGFASQVGLSSYTPQVSHSCPPGKDNGFGQVNLFLAQATSNQLGVPVPTSVLANGRLSVRCLGAG